ALLGGNNPESREKYFNLFHLAYNIRSKLIHGSIHNHDEIEKEIKKKQYTDSTIFMAELDNMLRQCLRYVLLHAKDAKSIKSLHDSLDKVIRRGESFSHENNA
ncbi:MAG: hypothetical protein MUE40_15355, partial [Anaerolineae bacterium]|nr:hypothetical protein [Anaerolineae bacterium]